MKKIGLFVLFLCAYVQGITQESFIQIIEGYKVSVLNGIFSAGGGLVLHGTGINTTGYTFVRKIDQSGLTGWEWRSSGPGSSILCGIADDEGNIFLCSYVYGSNLNLIKLSGGGDSLWQRELTTNEPYGLRYTHDQKLLLFGKTGEELCLIKLNMNGEVRWSKPINPVVSGSPLSGISYFEMADGKIVVLTQSAVPYRSSVQSYFHLFNSDGDSLAQFPCPVLGPSEEIWSAAGLNDDEIVIAGKYSGAYNVAQRFIAGINLVTQEIIWQKPLLEDALDAKLLIAGVTDDKVMVSGTVQYSFNTPLQALFMGFTSDGEPLFERSYGTNFIQEIRYACLADDGGIAAAGITCLNDSTRGYLIKTDPEGNVNLLNIHEKENKSAVSCYPNPASGFLHINAASGIRSVELIDLFGRRIRHSGGQGSNRFILPLDGIRSGLLTVRVTLDSGITATKVLIR